MDRDLAQRSSTGGLLFKGGYLLTQDPAHGEVRADLLVRNSRIEAIGAGIEVADAEVIDASGHAILPGFVDTHRHTWQTALRGLATGASLDQYQQLIQRSLGALFTPDDVYAGNLLGALSAAQSGITTLCDESHVQNSNAHTDSAVRALRDSGIRAVFDYGWPSVDSAKWMVNSSLTHPTYVRELQARSFTDSSAEALVTLRMMLRGPLMTPLPVVHSDLQFARELGLRSAIHVIGGNIQTLSDEGLLGPDLMFIHCCDSTDRELRLTAEAGATVSSAPNLELNMSGFGKTPPIGRFLAAGLRPSLSIDVETSVAGDMFSVMRAALMTTTLDALNGEPVAGALNPAQVLAFATLYGAESCGLADRIGSLTPGKQADLILIRMQDDNLAPFDDATIAGQIVSSAHPGNVTDVMVAGRFVRRDGRAVRLDQLTHAVELAAASRRSLLNRRNGRVA